MATGEADCWSVREAALQMEMLEQLLFSNQHGSLTTFGHL